MESIFKPFLNIINTDELKDLNIPKGAIILSKVFIEKDRFNNTEDFKELEYLIKKDNEYLLFKVDMILHETLNCITLTQEQIDLLNLPSYMFISPLQAMELEKFYEIATSKEKNISNTSDISIPRVKIISSKIKNGRTYQINLVRLSAIPVNEKFMYNMYTLEEEEKIGDEVINTEFINYYHILPADYDEISQSIEEKFHVLKNKYEDNNELTTE